MNDNNDGGKDSLSGSASAGESTDGGVLTRSGTKDDTSSHFCIDDDEGQNRATNTDTESVHDQLPGVEEYKASQGITTSAIPTSGRWTESKHRNAILIAATVVCLLAWVALMTVVLTNDLNIIDEDIAESYHPLHPGKLVVPPELSRIPQFQQFIAQYKWSKDEDLKNTASPQYQAAEWLADYDDMKISLGITTEFVERYALGVFYYAMQGLQWNYDSNFLTAEHVCEWKHYFATKNGEPVRIGILCDVDDLNEGIRTVNQLFLPTNNLVGSLPTEIGLLKHLYDINLFNNYIHGDIPSQAFLSSFDSSSKIRSIILHDNDIDGSFPTWIHKLPSLRILNLATNSIGGSFPDDLNTAPSLEVLNVNSNYMTGSLDKLNNMTSLINLQLDDNDFGGKLTDDLLDSWTNLKILDAGNNAIQGEIPKSLLETNNLEVVDLSNNELEGQLPQEIKFDSQLKFLALQDNQLTGKIDVVTVLINLEHLDLSDNGFTGSIPTQIGDLSNLRYLFLAFNDGFNKTKIPSEIGKLSNLQDLSLQESNLIGTIPGEVFSKMSSLVMLDLNNNDLTGSLPAEIGQMANLTYFMVQYNSKLNGTIPSTYQNLQNLDSFLILGSQINKGAQYLCQSINSLKQIVVDCDKLTDLPCDCCKCCDATSQPEEIDTDSLCNSFLWYFDVDPVSKYQYDRGSYAFQDEDIELPFNKSRISNDDDDNSAELYDELGMNPDDDTTGNNINPIDTGDDYVDDNENDDGEGLPQLDGGVSRGFFDPADDSEYGIPEDNGNRRN